MPLVSADLLATLSRWPRRIAALVCLLLAAGSALVAHHHGGAAGREPATDVVVAAHHLAAGATLDRGDLTIARWPPALVPAGTVPDAARLIGKRVSGAVGRGEAITTARLVGVDLAAGLAPGQLAVPVTVADPTAAALIRPGDRIDLIAAPEHDTVISAGPAAAGGATVVATGLRVLAVLPHTGDSSQPDGVAVIVSADRVGALRIAALAARQVLAVRDDDP